MKDKKRSSRPQIVHFPPKDKWRAKKGHHALRCPIFRPKTSEKRKKGHHALRSSFIQISPLLCAFVCGGGGRGNINTSEGGNRLIAFLHNPSFALNEKHAVCSMFVSLLGRLETFVFLLFV